MRCSRGYGVLAILVLLAGCGEPERTGDPAEATSAVTSELVVYVVNYPLQYFAERIGGTNVQVEFPAPPDGDPAFWSPGFETVAAYQSADLILLNGAHYAKWVDKVTLPPSKLVDTSESFEDQIIYVEGAVTHSHGPGGEHSHGEAAFTTWLDPALGIEQARAVQKALASARPEESAAFQRGLDSLEADLNALDESLGELAAGMQGIPLVSSHPVYQYLARTYELEISSVHFEPDEYPDEQGWRSLQGILAENPVRFMLWEGEPLSETVEKLRELDVESVVFDPCGKRPAEGDYLSVMKRNLTNLQKIETR